MTTNGCKEIRLGLEAIAKAIAKQDRVKELEQEVEELRMELLQKTGIEAGILVDIKDWMVCSRCGYVKSDATSGEWACSCEGMS